MLWQKYRAARLLAAAWPGTAMHYPHKICTPLQRSMIFMLAAE
jgi:hypothetical protein